MDEEVKKSVIYILERIEEGIETTGSARMVLKQSHHLYLLLRVAATHEEQEDMLHGPFGIGN